MFQPIRRNIKIIANTKHISLWKSKGLFDETIKPYATSDNSLTLLIHHYLKQSNNLTYDYGSRANIYIVYELGASSSNDSNPTLKNCLSGAVTLTKKADIEKYGYSGYGVGFDDDLPLNKPLKFRLMTITIRSGFEDGKLYPHVFLDDTLYELRVRV